MSIAPLDLVAAHPWQRAAFTTYALSLSFFEAVVLDALVRAEAREALILADVDGVRAALGEYGARRVGRDYEVEPVAVDGGGVFHPKITVLTAPDECHLLVGSGNLTFGGWGGNFEVIEHLHPSSGGSGAASWSRFMQCVFAAFREKRGPLGQAGAGHKGDDDDDETQDPKEAARTARFVQNSLANFEKLLDLLLSDENAPTYATSALDLTQYVCQRLQPYAGTARRWVNRVVDTIIRVGPPPEDREEIAAAILTLLGASEEGAERTARSRLIRLGWDLSGGMPLPEAADGLQSVLTQSATFPELWARVQKVRTYSEQVRAYLSALQSGRQSTEYADLAEVAREEWPTLEKALGSAQYAQDRLIVLPQWSNACPRHYMTLPTIEENKLRSIGIATCKNCCNRVLIYPGN